jgi:purine nucleosidase
MRFYAVLLTVSIAFAQGVSPTRKAASPEFPRRIIIDTDPGIDDAMALLLALRSPELKIEAITVVAGNVPVELGSENARKLVELAGRTDVIVAKGAAGPLVRKLRTAELIHGENGLAGVNLPVPKLPLEQRHAVEVIRDVVQAHPGGITLVPIGPLTNIALAFQRYPHIAPKVREIIFVGGTVGSGLVTPVAEPNIYQDAEAAKAVFESGVPIVMVDLTACAQTTFTRKDVARLRESKDAVASFVAAISEPYLKQAEQSGSAGARIYDALGVGIAIDPLVAKTLKPIHVAVETKGEFSYGATVTNQSLMGVRFEARGNRLVVAGFAPVAANAAYPAVVDGERFMRLFSERIMHASPPK